jgi:electron transport complex protein RnfD
MGTPGKNKNHLGKKIKPEPDSTEKTADKSGIKQNNYNNTGHSPSDIISERTAHFTENLLLTVSPTPHIKSEDNTRVIMLDVLVALTPALIWAVYIFGWRALTMTVVSVVSCVLFELWYQLLMHRPVTVGDLSAAVTGVLIAFNLPVTASLWIPVAGAFFAVVLVKQLFGGIGKNIVNPAIAARVFIFSSWTKEISVIPAPFAHWSATAVSVDAVATATPLASLKAGAMPDISLFDLIIGNCPGVIGEVSALLLAAGGLYLLVRHVISWRIPFAYIATVALITYFFPLHTLSMQFMLYQLFSGGLMLGAIFMATDYTTSPMTDRGKLIYGAGCGLITVLIRYYGGYTEGVSFAIMIMNLMVWYLDSFTKPVRFGGAVKNAK